MQLDLHLKYFWAGTILLELLLGYAIVLFYITFGGFIAVAWSDFIQGSLMFLALCSLPIIGLFFLEQGNSFLAKHSPY